MNSIKLAKKEITNTKPLFVLAGGFGTRLRSVVSDVPKPMAPIGDQLFLHYQIKNWVNQGVKSFVFLLYHQADIIIDYLRSEENGLFKFCNVSWLVESEPMGTGGAVANAVKKLNVTESFLVTNADTWLGSGITEILLSEEPSMAIIFVEDSERYGSVHVVGNNINLFREKSSDPAAGWINAGLYHLDSAIFQEWDQKPFSMENVIFPALASKGKLKAVEITADFIDIGIPSDYQKFCDFIKLTI